MSDRPPKRSSKPPRAPASGEHPAVTAFRDKLESIQDGVLEELAKLNRKLDEAIESRPTVKPPKDPRREGDSEPPVDVVEEKKP